MVLYSSLACITAVKNVAHEKIKSLFVMLAVFGCVAAISWVVVNSHAPSEVFPNPSPTPQLAGDAASKTVPPTQTFPWTSEKGKTSFQTAGIRTELA